jgi:PadR family transcriptional regulator PadR
MDSPFTARAALLQVLVAGDGFGLELIERVRQRSGVQLGQGSAYPALRALERDGLVKAYEGESLPERGGRPRIYYRITGEGMRVAAQDRKHLEGLLCAPIVAAAL